MIKLQFLGRATSDTFATQFFYCLILFKKIKLFPIFFIHKQVYGGEIETRTLEGSSPQLFSRQCLRPARPSPCEWDTRIGLVSSVWKTDIMPLYQSHFWSRWGESDTLHHAPKASVLPVNYTLLRGALSSALIRPSLCHRLYPVLIFGYCLPQNTIAGPVPRRQGVSFKSAVLLTRCTTMYLVPFVVMIQYKLKQL